MKHLDILNIYKLSIYQMLHIMFRVKTNLIPETFQNKFKVMEHNYSTRNNEHHLKDFLFFLFFIFLLNLQYCHVDMQYHLWNKRNEKF